MLLTPWRGANRDTTRLLASFYIYIRMLLFLTHPHDMIARNLYLTAYYVRLGPKFILEDVNHNITTSIRQNLLQKP